MCQLFPVRGLACAALAGYYQMGMSVDEILSALSHLRPSQVHSALAYYFDHQEEIEKDLAEASDIEYWKSQARVHPKAARLFAHLGK